MGCCQSNERVPELPSEYSAGGCSSEYANIGPNPLAHTHFKGNELTSGDSSDVDTHPTAVSKTRLLDRHQKEQQRSENPLHSARHKVNLPTVDTNSIGSWSMEDAPPPEEQLPDRAMAPAVHEAVSGEPVLRQDAPSHTSSRATRTPSHEDANTPPLPSTLSDRATSDYASTTLSGTHVQNLMSYMSLVSGSKSSTHGSSRRSESDRRLSVATSRMWATADSGSERWEHVVSATPSTRSSDLTKPVRASSGGGQAPTAWHASTPIHVVPPAEPSDGAMVETLCEKTASELGSSESGSLNSMDPDYDEQWARRLRKVRPLNDQERDAALGRWLGNIVANLPPPLEVS